MAKRYSFPEPACMECRHHQYLGNGLSRSRYCGGFPKRKSPKGVHISDRKYFSYAPIAQAKAWLEGRDMVESSDLTILRHYLWTAPEERAVIQGTLERMCNDPLKDRLDGILASALESYEDFNQSVDAPAARRIGKLRDEYLRLYEQIAQMDAAAQNDGERQKIQDCLNEMEKQSQAACDAIHFSYVPLSELHDLKAG